MIHCYNKTKIFPKKKKLFQHTKPPSQTTTSTHKKTINLQKKKKTQIQNAPLELLTSTPKSHASRKNYRKRIRKLAANRGASDLRAHRTANN